MYEGVYMIEEITKISEGLKYDSDKLRMDLIPPEVIEQLATVLTYGAKKYSDRNWEKGIKYNRVYGALQRHLNRWMMGEDLDKESGLLHLSHALTCLSFLVTYEQRNFGKEWDNLCRK
jgi:hypothetical protein